MTRRLPALLLLILLARGGVADDDTAATDRDAAAVAEAPVVDAAAAADHVGEECVVELTVQAARLFDDGSRCFLNSRENHRDADNFTVVIFREGLARFREADIENPADHFLHRVIRVRGVVAEHKERPQIVVEEPEQIELVDEPATADAAPE